MKNNPEVFNPINEDINHCIQFGLRRMGYMWGDGVFFDKPIYYPCLSAYLPSIAEVDYTVSSYLYKCHRAYRQKGLFTAPFLVRFVLRGFDGSCIFLSKPQLMTGGLLPPCVKVAPMMDPGRFYGNLEKCGCFSLMIRSCVLPTSFEGMVRSIDVYVSPQISTYFCEGGHMCQYKDVLAEIRPDSRIHDLVRTEDFIWGFCGLYSEDGINFTYQGTDAEHSYNSVWYVAPNNNLEEKLAEEDRFYRIASFDADEIDNIDTPLYIPVSSTEITWLEANCDKLGNEKVCIGGNPVESIDSNPEKRLSINSCRLKRSSCTFAWYTDNTNISFFNGSCGHGDILPGNIQYPPPRQLQVASASGLSPPM